MSGESFTISITGDSNDSNLVLASASGVITENTSANLGVLEGKVTALEAKYVVFASDLDKLVVADSSFTLDINNLQEDVVNLKKGISIVHSTNDTYAFAMTTTGSVPPSHLLIFISAGDTFRHPIDEFATEVPNFELLFSSGPLKAFLNGNTNTNLKIAVVQPSISDGSKFLTNMSNTINAIKEFAPSSHVVFGGYSLGTVFAMQYLRDAHSDASLNSSFDSVWLQSPSLVPQGIVNQLQMGAAFDSSGGDYKTVFENYPNTSFSIYTHKDDINLALPTMWSTISVSGNLEILTNLASNNSNVDLFVLTDTVVDPHGIGMRYFENGVTPNSSYVLPLSNLPNNENITNTHQHLSVLTSDLKSERLNFYNSMIDGSNTLYTFGYQFASGKTMNDYIDALQRVYYKFMNIPGFVAYDIYVNKTLNSALAVEAYDVTTPQSEIGNILANDLGLYLQIDPLSIVNQLWNIDMSSANAAGFLASDPTEMSGNMPLSIFNDYDFYVNQTVVIESLVSEKKLLKEDVVNLENSYPINFFLGKYESGPYAKNGIEYTAGISDYFTLVNQKGGVNDLEINLIAEETRYDTTITINKLKQKTHQNGGLVAYSPLSTGSALQSYDYSKEKKLPILNMGYGDNQSICGELFPYAFNAAPTYNDEMASFLEAIKEKYGTLEDKKIAYIYHDSIYGKTPLPVLKHLSKVHTQYTLDTSGSLIINVDDISGPVESSGNDPSGCISYLLPVDTKTTNQDSQFLFINSISGNVDAIFILSWGGMIANTEKNLIDNPELIEKMYYGWWGYNPQYRTNDPDLSGTSPSDFSGLNILTFNSMGYQSTDISMTTAQLNDLGITDATNADISGGIEILEEIRSNLYSAHNLNNYTFGYFKNSEGFSDETILKERAGNLYMRGVLNGFIIKKALEKAHLMIGKTTTSGRPKNITSEQLKNALDNLTITQDEIDAEGMTLNCQPITMTEKNHKGANGLNVYTANSEGVFELKHSFLKYPDEDVINELILN